MAVSDLPLTTYASAFQVTLPAYSSAEPTFSSSANDNFPPSYCQLNDHPPPTAHLSPEQPQPQTPATATGNSYTRARTLLQIQPATLSPSQWIDLNQLFTSISTTSINARPSATATLQRTRHRVISNLVICLIDLGLCGYFLTISMLMLDRGDFDRCKRNSKSYWFGNGAWPFLFGRVGGLFMRVQYAENLLFAFMRKKEERQEVWNKVLDEGGCLFSFMDLVLTFMFFSVVAFFIELSLTRKLC